MTRRTLPIIATLVTLLLAAIAGADEAQIARGEQLYGLCLQCHGTAGAGNPLSLAPAIAGQPAWYVERQVKNWKQKLRGTHPDDLGGLRMYPMSLALKTDEDIAAVAAYIETLPTPELETTVDGDPERGKAFYAPCVACHGANGLGNPVLNAPRLVGTSDWYLVETLKKWKAGVRGYNPDNQNSAIMRGMSLTLPDDQAIRDVVAHIQTLSSNESGD